MSFVPVWSSKLRLAREPVVDPIWVTRESGATATDCREEDRVAVGVFAVTGVEVFVAVGKPVDVKVTVGESGVLDGVRVNVAVTANVFVGVTVKVLVGVVVFVNVAVGGMGVLVKVFVGAIVLIGVKVNVLVGVAVLVNVLVGGIGVFVKVLVGGRGVLVNVLVGSAV